MGESSKAILFPWLLYSHGEHNPNNKTLCNIVSSTHQFSSIRQFKNKIVLGSSHGWLILKNKKTDSKIAAADFYSLWNPNTFESIDFPPFNSKPEHKIMSFILSSPPSHEDPNSMLLLFESTIPAIFVCRPSNPEWIELRYSSNNHREYFKSDKDHRDYLYSPISCNGDIFAISYNGDILFARGNRRELFRIEIKFDNTISLHPLMDIPPLPAPHSFSWNENLVECSGEMFIVYCTIDARQLEYPREIIAVHVFKSNFSEMIWEKVDNIQSHAFFLSRISSISCPSTSLSSFQAQRNRIYFTMEEDDDEILYSYHVEDGTLTMSCPCPYMTPPWTSPIWVTLPTLGTNKGEEREETLKALVFAEEERKDNEKNVVFPWTNLPMNLQTFIAMKLQPFDYINLRGTCRMNRIIAPTNQWRIKPAGSNKLPVLFPWLIYSPSGKTACNIIDPNLKRRCLVKTPELFQDPVVRCCKEGWLLMSTSEYNPEDNLLAIFFFNPLTRDTIQLPSLEVRWVPLLCFSWTSSPYSDDCYVVCFLNLASKVSFLVKSPGKEEWTFLGFSNDDKDFYPLDNVPVFLDGNFYYLSEEKEIGALKIMEEGWSWQVWEVKGRPDDFRHNYLVECDGDLLSVFVGDLGKWVKVFKLCKHDSGTLFRLEPVLDLGKHVLYLSRLSTVYKVAEVEGTENRIYFERLYKEKVIFYSLTTQKFHVTDGKDSLRSFYNTTEPLHCAWIEPSWC